jgi:ATP synthase protein I
LDKPGSAVEHGSLMETRLTDARTQQRLPFHKVPVFPLLVAQLLAALLAVLGLFMWLGPVHAYSGLCGGLIAWLPNLYFARMAFRFSGARAARQIIRSFYAGEAGKFILTAVLFALAFLGVKPLEASALFGVFLLTQAVSWLAPLLMKKRSSRPSSV